MQFVTAVSGGSVLTFVSVARPFCTVTLTTTFIVEGALHAVTKAPRTRGAPSCALESGAACLRGTKAASGAAASPASTGSALDDRACHAGSSHGESLPVAVAETMATTTSAV